jgi:sedoheptulose-bisphosphatase
MIVSGGRNGQCKGCRDPLDGSSIVDNNWAVGTIIGVWDKKTGILGATGRDQVTSIVVLYGPRTTALVACDDGVYEFTCGAGGLWVASRFGRNPNPHLEASDLICLCFRNGRERVTIKDKSKIFSPANLRATQVPCSI